MSYNHSTRFLQQGRAPVAIILQHSSHILQNSLRKWKWSPGADLQNFAKELEPQSVQYGRRVSHPPQPGKT